VVTKTGPATLGLTLNLGQWGEFTIDAQNTGLSDAWNVTILDRLPDGARGGMCNMTPQVLSAQVFAADGVTLVPGKAPLISGTDFSLSYNGAPTCELALTMLTAAGVIGQNERLIITYRTQLDADSQDGVTLTNVVGATQWFNGDSSDSDRQAYARALTDGTVGVLDHEDAHTVTAALYGYFFEKSVENLTSGVSPTTTATPGDALRYTLRLQTTDVPLDDLTFYDDLGALNASAAFVPGTLTLVASTIPAGSDTTNTDPNGGTNGAGILDIRNLSVPANSEILVQFDITLDSTLTDGTVVANQADLISTVKLADSDDPNINGQADPDVAGDEDPTRVVIATVPVGPLLKENTQPTASVGETFSYQITVPETPYPFPVYDVQLTDDLTASAADLRFLGVTKITGSEPWAPVNTGTDTNVVIEDTTIGIDIPAGEQVVVEITVVLEDTPTNVAGLTFTNTASFLYNRSDGDVASQRPGDPGTTEPMTIVGLLFAPKSVALLVDAGTPGIVDPGDVLRYTITVYNNGAVPATGVVLTDDVPANTTYVADSTTLNALPVGQPDGGASPLQTGIPISSSDLTPPLPGPGAGTISAGESGVIEFHLQVDAGVPGGTIISNQAVVGSNELPSLLTDGDGNPATGPEPTMVVVGNAQQLSITKDVMVVGGGAAFPGSQVEYVVRAVNIAAVPAFDVVITDDLDVPVPGQLAYVPSSATMNGSTAGVTVAGSIITADYSGAYGPLQPGQAIVLRFRAVINSNLAIATTVVCERQCLRRCGWHAGRRCPERQALARRRFRQGRGW
jgi:uncharacterized repeat protein (TIGR01451 family)